MNAEEARRVDAAMRRLALPGVVAPVDPRDASGEWRVYDQADPDGRFDITADTLVAVVVELSGARPSRQPPQPAGWPAGPARGFVYPPRRRR
ncbi:hypothetical protein ACWGJ2_38670 [Streptomyces sp. NPDC054796]